MEFGEFLKMKRKEKQMSINQLALYANCSDSYLSLLERGIRGKKGPSPSFLRKLAKPLGVPYDELMSIAGYINLMPNVDASVYPGELIFLLQELLGDESEAFAKRFNLNVSEIEALWENGITRDVFAGMHKQLFSRDRLLTSSQRNLIQRLIDTFQNTTQLKSAQLEATIYAVLEVF